MPCGREPPAHQAHFLPNGGGRCPRTQCGLAVQTWRRRTDGFGRKDAAGQLVSLRSPSHWPLLDHYATGVEGDALSSELRSKFEASPILREERM